MIHLKFLLSLIDSNGTGLQIVTKSIGNLIQILNLTIFLIVTLIVTMNLRTAHVR